MKRFLAYALAALLSVSAYAQTFNLPDQAARHAQGLGRCFGCTHVDDFMTGTMPVDVSFARASSRTCISASATVVTLANDVPCFDYDPTAVGVLKGLLVEEARTNALKSSAAIGDANWINTTITAATNSVVSPDGTTNATLETNTNVTFPGSLQLIGSSATGSYSISEWIKQGTALSVVLKLTDQTANAAGVLYTFSNNTFTNTTAGAGTVNGSTSRAQAFPNGWVRIAVTVNFSSTAAPLALQTGAWDNVTGTGTNGATLSLWGAQSEAATAGAGSYIPTTSAAVTRAADLVKIINIPWFNPNQGTFVAESVYQWPAYTGNSSEALGTLPGVAGFNTQGGGHSGWWNNASNISTVTPSFTFGVVVREGFIYFRGQRRIITNGGSIVTDTAQAWGTTPTTFTIGSNGTGGQSFNSWARRFYYWNSPLSDGKFTAVTAR